jgi:hypothetical protein
MAIVKHRVERDLTSTDWLVLNPDGDVVYQTPRWTWAIDEAILRYYIS